MRQSPTADIEGIAGNKAVERGLMQLVYHITCFSVAHEKDSFVKAVRYLGHLSEEWHAKQSNPGKRPTWEFKDLHSN